MKLKTTLFVITTLLTPASLTHAYDDKSEQIKVGKEQGTSAKVSYYGPGFHGKKTASGKPFNMHGLTVAHKTLPFGTKVNFTCTVTGRSVTATVTDRGPYVKGRTFDLSLGTAKALGIVERGVATVRYKILQ